MAYSSMFVDACGRMAAMPRAAITSSAGGAPLVDDPAACCSPITGGVLDGAAAHEGAQACGCDLTGPWGCPSRLCHTT
jgi:hypothetical protein